MEFVTNIKKDEYEEFLSRSNYVHFMQSYSFGQIRKTKKFIPHYVGIKSNEKLICTALLLEKRIFGKWCYFYSPRGFIIDYQDKDLLKTFTKYLQKYCRIKKALFLRIDPAIKRHSFNTNGEIIEGKNSNNLIRYLKKLGYKHNGFNKGFNDNEEPRFTFRINIDKPMDEVYKNFHATTRKILNKGNQYNLKVYKGDLSDINAFYETMIETSKREGLIQSSLDYYKTFYWLFRKEDMSDLYLVKANCNEIKGILLEKLKDNKDESQVNKINKLLLEIENIREEEITLASIITVKYHDILWTVHGGNNSKLMSLNANYLLYYEIIKDANHEGVKTVDLFGTCGDFNPEPTNPVYGIHLFKKRLGGEYTEFIGEFDLIINKPLYYVFKMLNKIRHRLKKMQ